MEWKQVAPKGNVYPYRVRPSRQFKHEETKALIAFLKEMFGDQTTVDLDQRYVFTAKYDSVSFRTEEDCLLFLLGVNGMFAYDEALERIGLVNDD